MQRDNELRTEQMSADVALETQRQPSSTARRATAARWPRPKRTAWRR
jgi:hypothetical protein